MKTLKTTLLSAALMLTAIAASAGTYDFSYTFDGANTQDGNPLVVTGSFTGVQSGTDITDIANVHVFTNGVEFSGPLYAEAWNDTTSSWDGAIPAVVSTDVTKNNFIFADTDVSTDLNASNFFWIDGGQALAINFNQSDASNNALFGYESASASRWSVVAAAPVPEPGSYALLIAGLAAIGTCVSHRRNG